MDIRLAASTIPQMSLSVVIVILCLVSLRGLLSKRSIPGDRPRTSSHSKRGSSMDPSEEWDEWQSRQW